MVPESDHKDPPPKRCPVCRGRGSLRCDCWPADCICGGDDEPCEECGGTGWYDPWYEYVPMTPAPTIKWRSPCGRGHVEERRGLYWGYIGAKHVCTQLSADKARDIVAVKLLKAAGAE